MSDPDRTFTTIDRDILKDRRVVGICLVNGKRWVVPLMRYMGEYKSIARRAERIINYAWDYTYVDREKANQFGMFSHKGGSVSGF